jgi:hypothetical protein
MAEGNITIESGAALGEIRRVTVNLPTAQARAAELVDLINSAGGVVSVYRSAYNPDTARLRRERDRLLMEAGAKAITHGGNALDYLPMTLLEFEAKYGKIG